MTENPVALVTGCSRVEGLGLATARQLAARGFHVVLTARDVTRAQDHAERLRSEGLVATGLGLDLTAADSIAAAGAWLTEDLGRLDVLVNNASTYPDFETLSPLDADLDGVRDALEVDVLGPWALIQHVQQLLRAAPAARIVNVGSIAALQLTAGLDLGATLRAPAHATGKHLLLALTTTMAKAFAATPVLVNVVDPGEVDSHPDRGDDTAASRTPDQAAVLVVHAATLDADGPTGMLFRGDEIVPVTAAVGTATP